MNLLFKPLSEDNIKEAVDVLHCIFPEDGKEAEKHYYQSLDPNDPSWKTHLFWRYYVVFDESRNKIIAITGFYNLAEHSQDEVWLGWYGVLPEARGHGVGRKVLEWTIQTAKENGFKKFRLWTTTSPDEAEAQKLYDSMGIKVWKNEKYKDSNYEKLYREILI